MEAPVRVLCGRGFEDVAVNTIRGWQPYGKGNEEAQLE